jgi:hypothetical protein
MFIDEVDEKGERLKRMWELTPIGNRNIKKMVYGIPPEGYSESKKAEPLEQNKWYSISDEYYFRIVLDSGKPKAEVLSRREFLKKFIEGR